jgi:hypothetical protein
MRFTKEFKPYKKAVTKRRISCAERAIKKQQNKIPLFADQITWPSPEERIEFFDQQCISQFNKFRQLSLNNWLEGRKILRSFSPEDKKLFLDFWNKSSIPARAEYFVDALKNWRQYL